MFDVLGVILALYTGYAVVSREVLAKSGPWVRTVSHADSPGYFWVVIAIYLRRPQPRPHSGVLTGAGVATPRPCATPGCGC